ncbi:hypothetical protein HK104_011134 [Borealophlyctis nickersoniae]|nr:hypothetical protein HK104_011134 [Borealophlyctis nickersoniae]
MEEPQTRQRQASTTAKIVATAAPLINHKSFITFHRYILLVLKALFLTIGLAITITVLVQSSAALNNEQLDLLDLTWQLRWHNEILTEYLTNALQVRNTSGNQWNASGASTDYLVMAYQTDVLFDALLANPITAANPPIKQNVTSIQDMLVNRLKYDRYLLETAPFSTAVDAVDNGGVEWNWTVWIRQRAEDLQKVAGEQVLSGLEVMDNCTEVITRLALSTFIVIVIIEAGQLVYQLTVSAHRVAAQRARSNYLGGAAKKPTRWTVIKQQISVGGMLLALIGVGACVDEAVSKFVLAKVMGSGLDGVKLGLKHFELAWSGQVYGEIMTSGAGKYVLTGNTKWIDSYNKYGEALGNTLSIFATLEDASVARQLRTINSFNDFLIAYETVALQVPLNVTAAYDAIYGEPYQYGVKIYTLATNQILDLMRLGMKSALTQVKSTNYILIELSASLNVLAIALTLCLHMWGQHRKSKLKRAGQEGEEGGSKIRDSLVK